MIHAVITLSFFTIIAMVKESVLKNWVPVSICVIFMNIVC